MKARLLLSVALALTPCLGLAQVNDLTITDENSSLKVTRDPPIYNFPPGPSIPIRLPRTMEWRVDDRTILVYPSSPWDFVDVEHFHVDLHVGAQQIHAQGPMIGYATSPVDGTVTGGAVYTVDGGPTGSLTSRIVEKVDINNKTGADLTVFLAGMGFRPPPRSDLPVPDYSGLEVTGTTTVFYQGNATKYSITEFSSEGFPPSVVHPIVSFSGFNPLYNETFTLPPGGVLTMITELKVKRSLLTLTIPVCETHPEICSRLPFSIRPIGPAR